MGKSLFEPKKILTAVSIFLFVLGFFSPHSLAQTAEAPTPTTLADEPASLAPTAAIESTDLGVPEPSGWQFFKRKFKRLFAFSQVRKLRLDIEIAKLTLLKARQAQNLGDTALAEKLLNDYQTRTQNIAQKITTLSESLKGQDPQVNQLLTQVQQDLVLEASLIDQLGAVKAAQLQKKLFKAKLDTLKHLTRLLAKENLPPQKLAQKIEQLSEKLTKKEAKIQGKIAKRLALVDNLDEADEAGELEGALEEEEEALTQDVAELQSRPDFEQILQTVSQATRRHLIVLQGVLEKVPDQAKPAIQAVIDKELEKLAERAGSDEEGSLAKLLPSAKKESREKARQKLLEQLKKLKEKSQKNKEEETKDKDAGRKKEKSRVKDSSSKDSTGEEQEGDSSSSETKPGAIESQSITIEAEEDELSPTTIEAKKNVKLIIRFSNRDNVSHILTFSNGTSSGEIPPKGITEIVLPATNSLSFSVSGIAEKGQIVLE